MSSREERRRQIQIAARDLDVEPFLDPANRDVAREFAFRIVLNALSLTPPRNDILQALFQNGIIEGSLVTDTLIGSGFLQDAQNYIQAGFLPTQEAEIIASHKGNVQALNFLVQHGFQPSQAGANEALQLGLYDKDVPTTQIQTLEWYKQRGILPFRSGIETTVRGDDLNPRSAHWAVQNNIPIYVDRIDFQKNYQAVLRAVLPVATINTDHIYDAIADGHYDELVVLMNAGYQFEPNMVDAMRVKANQGDVGMANLMRNAGLV